MVNTVLMGVYERTREFGTLRAIGARPAFVRQLVLSETLLLSVLGGVVGLGLAGLGGAASTSTPSIWPASTGRR
ncbi:FtsX-like permease family protein [Deinococcus radiopugnans]|uniref:FtsX-like permease family protein n=1 Tax=Deinococcus radiopugnans TaxID=57497 RepID=UPI00361AD64A